MPWRESSLMDQRFQFIADYTRGIFSMRELCTRYDVSRKTGYKWISRYEAQGPAGLADRSRRPHHSPGATEPEVVDALVKARQRHPHWGAKKLLPIWPRSIPTGPGPP